MLNSNNIVQSDELKSIYFMYQDTVLTNDGVLFTCDFESPSIDKIFDLIKHHSKLLPTHYGSINVKKIERTVVAQHIQTMSTTTHATLDTASLNAVAQRAHAILQDAVRREVSDIHIELYAQETRIEGRIDGRMVSLQPPIPEHEYGKLLFGYLFNEMAVDKDNDFYQSNINNGRIEIGLTTSDGVRDTIWRVGYIPAKDNGGQVTLRWLNKNEFVPSLDNIGWETGHVRIMRDFAQSASGIAFLAGQVGSGKTTTVASVLSELKGQGRSINTLEDPPEFDLGIIQSSVVALHDEEDVMFKYAKALLRHDVDIESHGEVRDTKGAMSLCRKGETGQIMFSTLHTSSALGIAHTLNEQMHVPSALIAAPNLMKLWIYQTLVRTLCPHCHLSFDEVIPHLTSEQLDKLEKWLIERNDVTLEEKMRFKNPDGCEQCNKGEKGRTTLVEMIVLDDEDRLFISKKDYLGWSDALLKKGFKPISEHAALKIKRGLIDIFTAAERVNGLLSASSNDAYQQLWTEE